jgi:hypothetical protein
LQTDDTIWVRLVFRQFERLRKILYERPLDENSFAGADTWFDYRKVYISMRIDNNQINTRIGS